MKLKRIETWNNRIETRNNRIETQNNRIEIQNNQIETPNRYIREIKVQIEKGNKSPNKIWKVNERIKKKAIPKITM